MTPQLTWLLALLAAGIVAVVLGVYWWMQRDPIGERPEEMPPLPLFGSSTGGDSTTPPEGRAAVAANSAVGTMPPVVPFKAPPTPTRAAAPHAAPAPAASAHSPQTPAESATPARARPVIREFSTVTSRDPTTAPEAPRMSGDAVTHTPSGTPVVNDAGVPGTMVEGHALRFSVPADGTLQFLPGRFEIGSGLDAGREIRFVHVPGPYAMNVTFGRSGGELYRHIQLRDKTVSRRHARMQLREGHWHLTNLSATNPVVWNGAELANEQEQRLAEGDRVEMGEVLFTFRSR